MRFLNFFSMIFHPRRMIYRNSYNNDVFVKYLRENGCKIGEGTRFISPHLCSIDPGRLSYIDIGQNCCLVETAIIAHDYSWYVFADAMNAILPDPGGEVKIGNNCFIGFQTCILKGTIIGNNCIIGARSLVKGHIPSNTVWAGVPAKQICTLEEMYEKKYECRIHDAIKRREHIRMVCGRDPTIREMGFFSFLFLQRTDKNFETIKDIEFNGIKNNPRVKDLFFSTVPIIDGFDIFLSM